LYCLPFGLPVPSTLVTPVVLLLMGTHIIWHGNHIILASVTLHCSNMIMLCPYYWQFRNRIMNCIDSRLKYACFVFQKQHTHLIFISYNQIHMKQLHKCIWINVGENRMVNHEWTIQRNG
jgi:hypothetical protein